ncbi:MAG TPA: hypothetical protein VEI03_03825 [Stellaceae bacterium]|nr:hypothetical protein [Stellaceae bacterium]
MDEEVGTGCRTLSLLQPQREKIDFRFENRAASYHAVGAKVWHRRAGMPGDERRGVVEDVVLGAPPITYCVRLEGGDCVWATVSDLLPR